MILIVKHIIINIINIKKYLALKNLKGGEDITWGFGIEQEFPINIKLDQTDKDIISQFGLSNNFINLQTIDRVSKNNLVFPTYQDIMTFDLQYIDERKISIFRDDHGDKLMKMGRDSYKCQTIPLC